MNRVLLILVLLLLARVAGAQIDCNTPLPGHAGAKSLARRCAEATVHADRVARGGGPDPATPVPEPTPEPTPEPEPTP